MHRLPGKTHTMCGDANYPGITMLAIREIFKEIECAVDRQFLLRYYMKTRILFIH